MEILSIITGLVLITAMVLRPYLRFHNAQAARDAAERFRFYKLRQIYRFYPQVLPLDWRELEERFDIEQSYQNIGTFGRR